MLHPSAMQFDISENEGYDVTVTKCRNCCRSFGFIVRKHNCRVCRKTFCGKCTNYRVTLPSYAEKQRVCVKCKDKFLRNMPSRCAEIVQSALLCDPLIPSPPYSESILKNQYEEIDCNQHMLTKERENTSLLDANMLQGAACGSGDGCTTELLLSDVPTKIGPAVIPMDTMQHPQVTARITPPAVKTPSSPTQSPNRCRCPNGPTMHQQLPERPTVTCMQQSGMTDRADCFVKGDKSRNGLCDVPESPLLPLRRMFRDPVTGKYIEGRDLVLDGSLVDDSEPYMVYDSDLDRTFEQKGSYMEDNYSTLGKRRCLDDCSGTDPHLPAVTTTSNTVAHVNSSANVSPGGMSSQGEKKRIDTWNIAAEDSVYKEECSQDFDPEMSGLTYHVVITAHELERKEALQEQRSCTIDCVNSVGMSGEKATKKDSKRINCSVLLVEGPSQPVPVEKGATERSRTRPITCCSRGSNWSSWNIIKKVHHDNVLSTRFSLRLVLFSVALIMVLNVIVLLFNVFAPHSLVPSGLYTSSLTYYSPYLEDNAKEYFQAKVDATSAKIGNANDGPVVVSDWSTESPAAVSTLRLHIGMRGLQTHCPVVNKRSQETDVVAASRFQAFEGVFHNRYELPLVKSEDWGSSISTQFLQRKQQVISLVLKKVLRLSKSLSRVIVSVIRRMVGHNQVEISPIVAHVRD